MKSLDDFINEQIEKDPEFKKAWEESEEKYQLERQVAKQMIKKKGMNQTDLTEQINPKQPEVPQIEDGKQHVTLNRISEIAQALDCDVEIVFRPR
jgi:DNA-binding Xre family transcriptional regulator